MSRAAACRVLPVNHAAEACTVCRQAAACVEHAAEQQGSAWPLAAGPAICSTIYISAIAVELKWATWLACVSWRLQANMVAIYCMQLACLSICHHGLLIVPLAIKSVQPAMCARCSGPTMVSVRSTGQVSQVFQLQARMHHAHHHAQCGDSDSRVCACLFLCRCGSYFLLMLMLPPR